MKKSRKIFTGVICAVMAFSSALPISAVEERGAVTHCPKCVTGAVSHHEISREWSGDVILGPCKHGREGFDKYLVYEVTVERDCNECSFNDTTSYKVNVYVECC